MKIYKYEVFWILADVSEERNNILYCVKEVKANGKGDLREEMVEADVLCVGGGIAGLMVTFLFKHLIEARKTKISTAPKPGSSHDKDNQYP